MKLWLKEKGEWKLFENVTIEDLKAHRVSLGDGVRLGDGVWLGDGVSLGDGVRLGNGVWICDGVRLGTDVRLGDGVWLGDGVRLCNGVRIKKTIDCIVLGPIGSRNEMLTVYRKNGVILCATGCFFGPIEKFEAEVKKKHAGTDFETDYLAACTYIRARMSIAEKADKK